MRAKAAAISLMIFLASLVSADPAILPADAFRTLSPSECLPTMPPCLCFLPPAVDRIAKEIMLSEMCVHELGLLNNYVTEMTEKPDHSWYTDPVWVVAGIGVSFALGGIVGYVLSQR